MPDYADTLAQLAQARDDAKDLLIELRGTIKDVKTTKREALDFIKTSASYMVAVAVSKSLETQTERHKQQLHESLEIIVRKIASGSQLAIDHVNQKEAEFTSTIENVTDAVENMNKIAELVKWLHDAVHSLNAHSAEHESRIAKLEEVNEIRALAVLVADCRKRIERLEEINDRRANRC